MLDDIAVIVTMLTGLGNGKLRSRLNRTGIAGGHLV